MPNICSAAKAAAEGNEMRWLWKKNARGESDEHGGMWINTSRLSPDVKQPFVSVFPAPGSFTSLCTCQLTYAPWNYYSCLLKTYFYNIRLLRAASCSAVINIYIITDLENKLSSKPLFSCSKYQKSGRKPHSWFLATWQSLKPEELRRLRAERQRWTPPLLRSIWSLQVWWIDLIDQIHAHKCLASPAGLKRVVTCCTPLGQRKTEKPDSHQPRSIQPSWEKKFPD